MVLNHVFAELVTLWFLLGFAGWAGMIVLFNRAGDDIGLGEGILISSVVASFGIVPFAAMISFLFQPEAMMQIRLAVMRKKQQKPLIWWKRMIFQTVAALVVGAEVLFVIRLWIS